MAITLTNILGTDSIAASRIIINDNFAIIRDEINAIESYLDPNSATLDGLNSIQTIELKVGPVGNFILDINQNDFNINTSLTLTQPSSILTIKGLISHDSFAVLDESSFTGTALINPLTGFGNYSIIHNSSSNFYIELDEAHPGQEITFSVEQKGLGDIIIMPSVNSTFVIDSTNNKIYLNDVGSTVVLKYIIDSSNNGAFYIIGGHNYTPGT